MITLIFDAIVAFSMLVLQVFLFIEADGVLVGFDEGFIRTEDRVLHQVLLYLLLLADLDTDSLVLFLFDTIRIIAPLEFPQVVLFNLSLVCFVLEFRWCQIQLLSILLKEEAFLRGISESQILLAEILQAGPSSTLHLDGLILGTLFALVIQAALVSHLVIVVQSGCSIFAVFTLRRSGVELDM